MISTLLDLRFERLLARRFLGAVYVLLAIVTLLVGLVFFVLVPMAWGPRGLVFSVLVVVPVTLVQLVLVRVAVEAVAVFFRIGDDVQALAAGSAARQAI